MSDYKIPTTLKHKPVLVVENYENVDGRRAGNSDAKGLSLGLAQWNDRGKVEISAKIWRHTGEKWSRQSEETPLHRVLDMTTFIAQSLAFFREYYHDDGKNKASYPTIARIGLQGDALNVAVCTENQKIEEDIELFRDCLAKDDEILSERLHTLSTLLKNLGY